MVSVDEVIDRKIKKVLKLKDRMPKGTAYERDLKNIITELVNLIVALQVRQIKI